MKALKFIAFYLTITAMCLFICIGYASVADKLSIYGDVSMTPVEKKPDVYITSITPESSAGVTVNNTNGTTMFASVNGSGTATFTVNVINISETIYVFDRVIDGAEVEIEGVYAGTEITYTLSGIERLDEIAANNGTRTFTVTVTVPKGVTAENYILKFKRKSM